MRPPSSQGPPMVPTEGTSTIFKLKSGATFWLSASNIGRGGGRGPGRVTPLPPTVYGCSNTSLLRVLQDAPLWGNPCTARAQRAHCALLLDYLPPKSPLARPLETPLGLGDPNWTGGDLEGDLPSSCGMVKDQGPLGGNLTVCWVAEMEGNQVASLNLGWQRRWTPSCIADSPLSTHLGSIPSGGVRLQPSQPLR